MIKFTYFRSADEPCEKGEIRGVRVEFDYVSKGHYRKKVLRYYVTGYSLYRLSPRSNPSEPTPLGVLIDDKFILSGGDDYRRKQLSRAVIHDSYFQERVFTVDNIKRISEQELSRLYNCLNTSEYHIIGDLLKESVK